MAKISITALRKRLPVGAELTGEFIGVNRQHCRAGNECTSRIIVTNSSHQLVQRLLTGPIAGTLTYLQWSGLTAYERDGSIFIADDVTEEFLKLTIKE